MGGIPLNPTKNRTLFAYVFIVFYDQKSGNYKSFISLDPPNPWTKIQVFMPQNMWDVYIP